MITPIHHKIYTLSPDDFMFQLNEKVKVANCDLRDRAKKL